MGPKLRITVGILAILVGVAGLVLPILQGWLFLAIGVILLSKDIPFVAKLLHGLEERYPRLKKTRRFAEKKLSRWKGKTKTQ